MKLVPNIGSLNSLVHISSVITLFTAALRSSSTDQTGVTEYLREYGRDSGKLSHSEATDTSESGVGDGVAVACDIKKPVPSYYTDVTWMVMRL